MTYHFETEVTKALEQSKYFDNIISDKNVEKKDEKYVIYKLNISPQVFDVILKYLYAGYVDITDKIGTELLNIIIASDKLYLENLTRFTKDYIVEHRQLLQNDPVGALQTVFLL
ncbi:BTB/POZ domain-containing protein [Rhizophagus irregularis DAOM 181602=DAOM 197198]|nr:BTB/POZ domain-containing protein [Rhizophagus irregularis DAOM 181602=DAOM 197198]